MTKSEYVSKLEKEFAESSKAFDELLKVCEDNKDQFPILFGVKLLVEGLKLKFKEHDDILINIINNAKFKNE